MTPPLPVDPVQERRSKWLGGEAHVRALGGPSLWRRLRRSFGPGSFSALALGVAFTAGGLLGAGLIGLACRFTQRRWSRS